MITLIKLAGLLLIQAAKFLQVAVILAVAISAGRRKWTPVPG